MELRCYLKQVVPDAREELKWGKPALIDDGILFQYAAFKSHVSLHPTPSVVNALRDQLQSYETSSNTIRFPLDQPIQKELVIQIASLRLRQKMEQGMNWKQPE